MRHRLMCIIEQLRYDVNECTIGGTISLSIGSVARSVDNADPPTAQDIYIIIFNIAEINADISVVVKEKDEQSPRKKREIPTLIQIRPVTPVEEYIHVQPSPRPFPVTTSEQIGWRSTKKNLALEKYGKYAKPKGGLIKQLNWPQEAVN